MVISKKKKKKGLHFDFISNFAVFSPRNMVISKKKKKKKKSLHFDFISNFAVFSPRDPQLGTTDIDSL